MFESMIAAIQAETIRRIFLARVQVGATTVKPGAGGQGHRRERGQRRHR